jgi:hypothetical protein
MKDPLRKIFEDRNFGFGEINVDGEIIVIERDGCSILIRTE